MLRCPKCHEWYPPSRGLKSCPNCDVLLRSEVKNLPKWLTIPWGIFFTTAMVAFAIWFVMGAYKECTYNPGDPAVERRLMAELVPAVEEECHSKSASDDTLRRGKAVVWDVEDDKRSSVYKKLSYKLRGYLPDPEHPDPDDPTEATIFLVLEKDETVEGSYGNGALAIRRDLHICVVYWPSQEVAGMHSIGASADFVCNSTVSCEGDADRPAAQWIEFLPTP